MRWPRAKRRRSAPDPGSTRREMAAAVSWLTSAIRSWPTKVFSENNCAKLKSVVALSKTGICDCSRKGVFA